MSTDIEPPKSFFSRLLDSFHALLFAVIDLPIDRDAATEKAPFYLYFVRNSYMLFAAALLVVLAPIYFVYFETKNGAFEPVSKSIITGILAGLCCSFTVVVGIYIGRSLMFWGGICFGINTLCTSVPAYYFYSTVAGFLLIGLCWILFQNVTAWVTSLFVGNFLLTPPLLIEIFHIITLPNRLSKNAGDFLIFFITICIFCFYFYWLFIMAYYYFNAPKLKDLMPLDANNPLDAHLTDGNPDD